MYLIKKHTHTHIHTVSTYVCLISCMLIYLLFLVCLTIKTESHIYTLLRITTKYPQINHKVTSHWYRWQLKPSGARVYDEDKVVSGSSESLRVHAARWEATRTLLSTLFPDFLSKSWESTECENLIMGKGSGRREKDRHFIKIEYKCAIIICVYGTLFIK